MEVGHDLLPIRIILFEFRIIQKNLGAHGIRNETTTDVKLVFVALTRDVQDVISCTNKSKFQRIIK